MQVEMSIKGLMVDPTTNMPIGMTAKGSGSSRSRWASLKPTPSLQIENISSMTHDLHVIRDLKADVQKVVVSDLKEGTFYAAIHLIVGGELLAIDARPSDAIALALRVRAPIFAEDTVIDDISPPTQGTPNDCSGLRRSTPS